MRHGSRLWSWNRDSHVSEKHYSLNGQRNLANHKAVWRSWLFSLTTGHNLSQVYFLRTKCQQELYLTTPSPLRLFSARDHNLGSEKSIHTFIFFCEKQFFWYRIEQLWQPPDSPHMRLCNIWLFTKLKGRFENTEDTKTDSTKPLMEIPKNAFGKCFQPWRNHQENCVTSEDAYFENTRIST